MNDNQTNKNTVWSRQFLCWLPVVIFMLTGQSLWAQSKQVTGVVKHRCQCSRKRYYKRNHHRF